MATHLGTELPIDALETALWRRKPAAGLIHHPDRGAQYAALSFGKRLEEAEIVPSMGRAGSALDNAVTESFVASLKTELLQRHHFPSREMARTAVFDYIEGHQTIHKYQRTELERTAEAVLVAIDPDVDAASEEGED